MGERRHFIDLAFRFLGSLIEAEDDVQETHAQWYAMSPQQQETVASPGARLTAVGSHICLDLLGRPERDVKATGRTGYRSGSPNPLSI